MKYYGSGVVLRTCHLSSVSPILWPIRPQRFLFDINLLKMDYKDDPTDLHTLFYLGELTAN